MDWTEIVKTIISLVLTGIVIPLVHAGFQYLASRAKSEKLSTAIFAVNNIVKDAVLAVDQTFVQELKEQGTFTAENAKQAMELAIQYAMNNMTKDVKNALVDNEEDIRQYLTIAIESYINKKGDVDG